MPLMRLSDAATFYRLTGPDDRPVLVLSHSLGQDHGMWDPQVADLSTHFRVLQYDTRGHGASSVTPGDYSVEQLSQDVLALADRLGIDRFESETPALGEPGPEFLRVPVASLPCTR